MRERLFLFGVIGAGLAAWLYGPLAELEAQSDFSSGYSSVMHYSSNRVFVLATFLPRYWQDLVAWASIMIAGVLSVKGASLDRSLRGAAAVSASLAVIGRDALALYCAAGCFLFYVARSSAVLNGIGLLVAPQCALLSRLVSASVKGPAFGVFVLVAAASFGVSFFAPDLSYPAYPPLGHVVPTYGVLFHEAARIGFAAPLDFGNLMVEQAAVLVPGLVLVVAGFGVNVAAFRGVLISLGLAGFFDAVVPGELSYLSPIRAITRLLPTLSELPPSSVFLGLAVPTLVISTLKARSLLGYLCLFLWVLGSLFLSDPSIEGAYFALPRSARIEAFAYEQTNAGNSKIVKSPSLYPIFLRGARFTSPDFKVCLKKTSLVGFGNEVTASANREMIPNLLDGRRDTRWTAGGGHQLGGEWLSVRLSSGPIKLVGIQLMTGEFMPDYARGLEVYYSSDCGATLTPDAPGQMIFHEKEWQGELSVTREGYPYFKEERYTELLFKHEIEAQCLFIRQIAKASFDWSITDLRLIEKPHAHGAECEPDLH